MGTPIDAAETRRLLEVHARLIDMGYASDEYVVAQVATQFVGDDRPSDAALHEAVGRAQVLRAVQRSFA